MHPANRATRFIPLILAVVLGSASAEAQDAVDIGQRFSPSGWMGDGMSEGGAVRFDGNWPTNPHSPPTAMRIEYTPAARGWAGMYWLNGQLGPIAG